jgi:hypothetical protein
MLWWLIVCGFIAGAIVLAIALARAAGNADRQIEDMLHDEHLARETAKTRELARADQLRHPERVRDNDGFRRD